MGIATQTSDGLKFSTTYMYVKNSSGTTLAAFKSDGKVGIGSATPTNKLTVNSGSQYTRGYLSQTADIHIANTSGSGSGAYAGALSFSSTDEANLQAASIAAIQTGSDQNQIGLTFNTQASEFGSTDLAEAVRIKHDGNIGIGTTDPGYLLDIDGHMRIRGQDTRWTNSTVYLRADTPFYFLAHSSGNAQRAHFKSIQVSTSYAGTPPDNGILFSTDTTVTRTASYTLTTNAKEFKIASASGDGVLKVYGAGGSDDGRIELLNQSGATSEGFKIRYDNDVGDTYFDNMWAGGSDANPAIRFRTKTAGTAVNAMTISHGGSVGINTTAPNSANSTKLDVRGSIYFDNNALIASMGGENSNVDHIWHDDGSYDGAGGAWNFISDGTYKQAGNSRLYAGHVYMAGSGTNYFNGAITANSNLTLSESLLGVSNSSLSQIGNIILDTNGEDLPVINHQLNNDLALMDAKGGTVTYGGLSSTPGSTANAFRSNSSFLDVPSSTISNSSNGFTITLESLPRNLTYSTRVGITFAHDGWRCSYVKIEVYRAGAWTQIREETSNTKATVYQFYNTSSSSISKIRYTIKNPVTTSIRIVSLFAFNYNTLGNSGYFLSQAGGTVYGSVGIGTASPSKELHVVGNSLVTGYTYIDDTNRYFSAGGNGVRLQTAHGYIQFGPQNSTWAHFETDRSNFYFNTNLTVNNGIVQSYDEDLVLNGSASNSAAILFKSGGTEYMRMDSSGNLGIGTASVLTNSKLTVNGGLAVGDASYGSNMNSGTADFSVDCNGTPQISWLSNYLQIGGTNQNWNMRMYNGLLQTYSNNLTITGGGTGTTYRLYLGTNGQTQTITCYNGSVGIGTVTPNKKLEVRYTSTSTDVTQEGLSGGAAGKGLLIYNTQASNNVYANIDFRANNADGRIAYQYQSATNVGDFHFITDNTNSPQSMMVIKNDGKVGMGTVSPNARLHVYRPAGTVPGLLLDSNRDGARLNFNYSSSTTTFGEIGMTHYGSSGDCQIWMGANLNSNSSSHSGPAVGVAGSSSTSWYTVWNTQTSQDFYGIYRRSNSPSASYSNYFRIKSDGNVGINTTNPTDRLHVRSVQASGNGSGSNLATLSLETYNSNNSNLGSYVKCKNYVGAGGGPDWKIGGMEGYWTTNKVASIDFITGDDWYNPGNKDEGEIAFTVYNNSTGNVGESTAIEAMRIHQSGNIGIGSTNPAYKLQVNGSFAASSKNFVIDHPTKENKQLVHGSLEGPENGVYYRGRAQSSTIPLPDYWSGLVREDTITVQLTPRGGFQHLYVVSTSLSQIVIGAADGETIDCFYTIYGARADIDSLVVEKDV